VKAKDAAQKQKGKLVDASQVEHYKSEALLAKREAKRLRNTVGKQEALFTELGIAIKAAKPFPSTRVLLPASGAKVSSPMSVVALASDWHVGQRTSREETEGFGEYSWAICQRRAFKYANDLINWVNVQRGGYLLSDLRVFSLSDHIAGDIHDELKITNEFPSPVQVVNAGQLLGEFIHRVASHFETVTVDCNSADNHSRLVKKPQTSQKAANSLAYLVHFIAMQYCRDIKNVTFNMPLQTQFVVDVQGWKFLLEHGDNIRGWSGIPHYGLQRKRSLEALKRMNTRKGFDYWCLLPGQEYWLEDGTTIGVENLTSLDSLLTMDGTQHNIQQLLNRKKYGRRGKIHEDQRAGILPFEHSPNLSDHSHI